MANILIVDDQPDTLYVLERLLRKQGHVLQTAQDGQTALDLMRTFHPDLIVLDVMMPGMTGFELLERLTRSSRRMSSCRRCWT
mgnify:CR=1 FL=1